MMEHSICKQGIVREIKDDKVVVEITMSDACGGCQAQKLCMSSTKKELITAINIDNEHFEIGETVNLSLKESLGRKAVMIGYFYPFLVLIISFIITYNISHNDWFTILFSLSFTALYYFVVWLLKKKWQKKFVFYIKKSPSAMNG